MFLWVFLEDEKLYWKPHKNRFSYDVSLLSAANWIESITNKSVSCGIFIYLSLVPGNTIDVNHTTIKDSI